MSLSEELDIEAYITQVGFENAFDSVEWPFLFETLKKMVWAKISYPGLSCYMMTYIHVLETIVFSLPF